MLSRETIKKVAGLLAQYPAVELAYLYGSRVRGGVHPGSDLDLAVVVGEPKKIAFGVLYSNLIRRVPGYELDLRIITINDPSPLFLFRVIRDNHCIYKRSERERVDFERAVLSKFYDTAYIRSIYHKYLEKHLKGGTYAL